MPASPGSPSPQHPAFSPGALLPCTLPITSATRSHRAGSSNTRRGPLLGPARDLLDRPRATEVHEEHGEELETERTGGRQRNELKDRAQGRDNVEGDQHQSDPAAQQRVPERLVVPKGLRVASCHVVPCGVTWYHVVPCGTMWCGVIRWRSETYGWQKEGGDYQWCMHGWVCARARPL